jgi:hypothetical protein
MNKEFIKVMLATAIACSLTACGSGNRVATVTAPPPTTIMVKLGTVAKAGESPQIKGLSISLLLPVGMTLKTVNSSNQTADGVVRYSGSDAFTNLSSQFIPRPLFGTVTTDISNGRNALTINFISLSSFGPGEFASVTCDTSTGVPATDSDFKIVDFHATGDSASLLADDLTALFDTPIIHTVQ